LVFSNILDCVRCHPAVSDALDEAFIGDFLLFDASQDLAATAFAAIRRLPPAHYLRCRAGVVTLHRYWSLSPEIPLLHYKRADEYVEHFQALLQTAVNDRLRTDNVTVMMSGGLDSSMVAATAKKLLAQQSPSFRLQAHTVVYDRLIPDQERYYAGIVAKALDIPIHYLVADDYRLYERWGEATLHQPEPVHEPNLALNVDLLQRMAQQSRVAVTGWDGDTFLVESIRPHFKDLKRREQWGQLLCDTGRYAWSQRWLQPLRYRRHLRPKMQATNAPQYPSWLNQAFAERLKLQERWQAINGRQIVYHPTRPYAYGVTSLPGWSQSAEGYAPNVTHRPLEVRHPLVDLRLVHYALALPVIPWLVHKCLIRVAIRGMLPTIIGHRSKAPLAGDPLLESLCKHESRQFAAFTPTSLLARFIEPQAVPAITKEIDNTSFWGNLRPHSLNYWLRSLRSVNQSFKQEKNYDERIQSYQATAEHTQQKSLSVATTVGLWHYS
jgi:asparagine synthase (glutamine-hydrolysing)